MPGVCGFDVPGLPPPADGAVLGPLSALVEPQISARPAGTPSQKLHQLREQVDGAAKVTAPFDAKTAGGTDDSAGRFVSAVYREIKAGKY